MTERRAHYAAGATPWLVTGAVLVLAVLPPFVGEGFARFLYAGFSFVCHQIPDRSFAVAGEPFAVCERCLGIYVGLFVASLSFPLIHRWDGYIMRRVGMVLVISLVPMGVDWLAGMFGIWGGTAAIRVATGVIFGAVAGYLFARAVREIIRDVPARPEEGNLVPQN